ncbi:MAG: hypothetical protein RI563_11725 [Thiohalophilus sp.]|uniref:hypothetical protein n=1 Tax=Thiohalophilus sp. TaxID=3028392 RepID=UPI00287093D8|nr:hypothetical protein [Thiohalophilus sp.]MDR9437543.1 hypothetical protein [Thiohalophilus sp.]
MRHYDINIRPGGHQGTDVPMKGVSAAEVFLLRKIHGEDAVIKVQPRKTTKIPHADLRDDLIAKYGESKVIPVFGSAFDVRLPEKLSDQDISANLPVDQQSSDDVIEGAM